jgi:hypothetical protein
VHTPLTCACGKALACICSQQLQRQQVWFLPAARLLAAYVASSCRDDWLGLMLFGRETNSHTGLFESHKHRWTAGAAGVLDTSLTWVAGGITGSQAFAAWDRGFDVWLGTSRCNPPHEAAGTFAAAHSAPARPLCLCVRAQHACTATHLFLQCW